MAEKSPQDTIYGDTVRFFSCGRDWEIARGDMEALWAEMDEFVDPNDERLPYWAELWPSSLALAKWLTAQSASIRGKRCLDLGCGLGFTALAGAAAGAGVIGADYERKALELARVNARLNSFEGPFPEFRLLDWRKPDLPPRSFDVIWGADIVYERQAAKEILAFLDYALAPGGTVWIAEPGRSVFSALTDRLKDSPFSGRKILTEGTPSLSPRIPAAHVNIWELLPRAGKI